MSKRERSPRRPGLKAWPLLRIRCSGVLAETISYSSRKSTKHTQIRDPQIETRLFPNSFAATSRFTFYLANPISSIAPFSPIQIYESEKEISKCGRGFETRSTPALARCYPRSFTFYLGNPFPRFLRSCFPD